MTVPKYYEFYNAFLEYLSNGQVAKYNDCKEYVKHRMNLSEKQLSELSESGGHIWENRVGWCATYLKNAGLVVQPKREQYQITDLGLSLLNEGITITDKVLEERCPMFLQFKKAKSTGKRLKKPEEQVIDAEKIADTSLIEALHDDFTETQVNDFRGVPREKGEPIILQGRRTYPRNRETAINALSRAQYCCEIDKQHPTFLRRHSKYQYTEPHHLVPMAYQDQFNVSLDVEENIVSLCCTCHKEIHYGEDAKRLVAKLYKERNKALKSVGIFITEKQLLDLYE